MKQTDLCLKTMHLSGENYYFVLRRSWLQTFTQYQLSRQFLEFFSGLQFTC